MFCQLLEKKGSAPFTFNMTENSFSIDFLSHTSTSTQSQNPPTDQIATQIRSALQSDLDQPVTEDYFLGILNSGLFQNCDSINLVNDYGQNLAHFCAELRYHRLLTTVIERGVDIHAKDANGWTPLDVARLHHDEDAIDILEGEWEDKIEDAISTEPLSIDLLRRFIPMLRSPVPPQPRLSISDMLVKTSDGESDIIDESHLLKHLALVKVADARALGIHRFPNEIIISIFHHCYGMSLTHLVDCIKRGIIHYGIKAPFVLQAVCRQWRSITRHDPKLWADLFINCDARNFRLLQRLDFIIKRSRGAPLAVYIQHIHTGIFGQRWFKDMVKVLNPTVIQWASLTMSFAYANDVHELLRVWPLECDRLQHIVLYGPVDGIPENTLPFSFPPPGAPIRSIHLRNIAWWQSRTFAGLREIAIGPSHEDLLTQNVIVSLLCATPIIERLKLLAFERADIPQPTHGLPNGFRLYHLHSLAASAVVLRTTLVGFDSQDVLPALVNVSVYFDTQDEEDTLKDKVSARRDSVRRKKDLRGVGVFLGRHFPRALKLRGLDEGYSPDAVTSLVFAPMNSSWIETMHFSDCVGHTTDLVYTLQRVTYGGGRAVFLFPLLTTLRLTRCRDIDRTCIADALKAGRPRPLHLVLRDSEMSPSA